ncbi:MAG: restriction endonuclease [Nanoarchaeota archaeon]|nr:restriction endonuclease [Nanoarchaeota archaeon]
MIKMNWKRYEKEIYEYFSSVYPKSKITTDIKITGHFSKVKRQIDLLIDDVICDYKIRIVVDAKYYNKKINVKDVESFIGLLRDVGAVQGVMISTEGYTKAAINRAYYDDLKLDLDILNFKDLKRFHSPAGALAYSGNHGVVLSAPFGWIIDGKRREGVVATLYQRGKTLESAAKMKEWMYVNFYYKDKNASDLKSLMAYTEKSLRKDFPAAKIEYQDGPSRKDAHTKIRIFKESTYPTSEYTGFVEFDNFIFFCVLFTPKELEARNLRKLQYILRTVLPMEVKHNGSN